MKFNGENFIGVFDSGIGGISVLNSTIKLMPYENYIFFADSNHFPYGTKTKSQITNIGLEILASFDNLNAKEVIIACNTMSTSNINLFKKKFKNIDIIGTFPDFTQIFKESSTILSSKTIYFDKKNGLKISNHKIKLLIIATTATSKSKFLCNQINIFNNLIDIYVEPADFIVKAVENDKLDTFEFRNYLSDLFKEYYDIDYLLLGCTHFPHAENYIRQYLNWNVNIFSGGDVASKNAYNYMKQSNKLSNYEKPFIKIVDNSIDNKKIELYKKLLKTNTHDVEFYKTFDEIAD